MGQDRLLAIDVGTTGLKAAVFDQHGTLLLHAQREYPTEHPHHNWAEQSPEAWWEALCAALQELWSLSPELPGQIAGLAVSAQAPAAVFVDERGKPTRAALIWMDRRADTQCRAMTQQIGADRVQHLSGNGIDPYYSAAKILWVAENEPAVFARTHQILQVNGYVVQKLCGAFTMDITHGTLTGLFDHHAGQWSRELCTALGVPLTKLPAVFPCSEVVGQVQAQAALETGLREGTEVLAGTVDGVAAAMEAGVVRSGQAAEMTGTSTVLLMSTDEPVIEPRMTMMYHAIPGQHLLLGTMVSTGASLKWFRDQLGGAERMVAESLGQDTFSLLCREAGRASQGSGGVVFLPYMFGERSPIWDTNARGVFFGVSLNSSRGDIIRSILEGTSFGLRHNVDVATETGVYVHELRSVGGGARDDLWCQIKADVLGIPVLQMSSSLGAPLGDAALVATACGFSETAADYLERSVIITKRFEPDQRRHRNYDAMYRLYRQLYPALRDVFSLHAQLREERQ